MYLLFIAFFAALFIVGFYALTQKAKPDNIEDIIKELKVIAKKYGVKKVIKVQPGDEYCHANGEKSYRNRSVIAGCDEIYLGIFDDEELMIASFFHEIGHVVNMKNNKLNSESVAWLNGFKVAKKYGYVFSVNAYVWAIEQIASYEKI